MVAACQVLVTREGMTAIQSWRSQLLADSERVEWSLRYVRETYKGGWQDNDEVLLELIGRFQAPSEVSPFWLRLESEPREAVRQWVLGRELNELLGDSRRVAFWRRYLPWMRLVNSNSDDEAVFVHFDDWSAVVFIQPGRATYLLSRDRIRGLSRHDSTQLYLRILHLKNTGYAIGRYEQRGGYWEYTAALEVGRVMRMME
jgi:hypothetical protein